MDEFDSIYSSDVAYLGARLKRANSMPQAMLKDSGVHSNDFNDDEVPDPSPDIKEHAKITKSAPFKYSEDGKDSSISAEDEKKMRELRTLKQHYYPEGGWGYVVTFMAFLVHILIHGFQIAFCCFLLSSSLAATTTSTLFWSGRVASLDLRQQAGWLGAMSTSVSLLISPITIAICRLKSTRLTAVMGGLITALGCLFTSFANQFHQLFFSYGAMIGIGVGMARDPATLMVGQYFKRKRELMEIFLVSGSGIGLSVMSFFIRIAIGSIGWRLGLQALTGVVFMTFFLGTFYRSASLYHPQRRAILHLKSQKRKIKNKDKTKLPEDAQPFFDFTTLKSRTVQILLLSISIASFGLNAPIYFLVQQAFLEGIRGQPLHLLQIYLGVAWTLGCVSFGTITINSVKECHISRQYLCQASLFMSGVSILAFIAVDGYNGYVVFVWSYGIFSGAYNYTLKVYLFEKVRARNFARAWGFAQFAMGIPNLIGVPLSGYINSRFGNRTGFYISAISVILGSIVMVGIDAHRRQLRKRQERNHMLSTKKVALSESVSIAKGVIGDRSEILSHSNASHPQVLMTPVERKLSFSDHDEIEVPFPHHSLNYNDLLDKIQKPENTLFSEEGIADMDLPDDLFEEDDEFLDNITSCDKVENCLMLSEYEQNLIKETENPNSAKKSRKWSLFRQPASDIQIDHRSRRAATNLSTNLKLTQGSKRSISVIDEASV